MDIFFLMEAFAGEVMHEINTHVFRFAAQQGSKLLNAVWQGSGSVVSSGIAAFGTSAIGKAAIAYYIDERTMEDAIKHVDKSKKENTES